MIINDISQTFYSRERALCDFLSAYLISVFIATLLFSWAYKEIAFIHFYLSFVFSFPFVMIAFLIYFFVWKHIITNTILFSFFGSVIFDSIIFSIFGDLEFEDLSTFVNSPGFLIIGQSTCTLLFFSIIISIYNRRHVCYVKDNMKDDTIIK